jgi:hypothetical protein
MNSNKKTILESFNKMKNIIETKLNEQPTAQSQQVGASQSGQQQPQQQQAQAVDTQKRDQQISNNIDATMDAAMKTLVNKLPNVLSNFSKSGGDKDGVLDAPGVYDNNQQQQNNQQGQQQTGQAIKEGVVHEITFDESKFMASMGETIDEGGLLGLAASAPAILKYGGKAAQWTGKKMNSKWLQKWGNKTAKAGEKLHHKYIGLIEKAITPFMPNASKEQIHKAAEGIFMGGVAVLFAGSLAHPGMLTGVKGAELGEFAASTLQKALPNIGFA